MALARRAAQPLTMIAMLSILTSAAAWALSEDELFETPEHVLVAASARDAGKPATFVLKYALEAPATAPEHGFGLFVCFHGHGGQAPHEARTVIATLKRLGLSDGYVVLGAKSQGAGWDMKVDDLPVTKLIAWAKQAFPIDPRRIYVFGMSSGGGMSGGYGVKHPESIAAAIIFGSGTWNIPAVKDAALTMPDFYHVMGLLDDDPHKNASRQGCANLKKLGYRSIYREVDGLGHTSNHPPTNDDSVLWATRLRHKLIAPVGGDLDALKAVLRPSKAKPTTPAAIEEVVRVGGPPAGPAAVLALKDKDPTVKTAAAEAFARSLFGDEPLVALARALRDDSAELRAAAFASLATCANWRYSTAQQALMQAATAKRMDQADRLLAIAGLAAAVRFQVKGNYQDPPLFACLVGLLDDDDQAVRAAAFAVLEPCQPSAYDAVADKPGRAAALGAWRAWAAALKPSEDAFIDAR